MGLSAAGSWVAAKEQQNVYHRRLTMNNNKTGRMLLQYYNYTLLIRFCSHRNRQCLLDVANIVNTNMLW